MSFQFFGVELAYQKWTEMKPAERRKFLFLVLETCEAADLDVRLKAARVLLYLVQGMDACFFCFFLLAFNDFLENNSSIF